jgi:D-alanyl-D-alanine carboxypeptidase
MPPVKSVASRLNLTRCLISLGGLSAGLALVGAVQLSGDGAPATPIAPAAAVPAAAVVDGPAVQGSSSSRAAVPAHEAQTQAPLEPGASTLPPATAPTPPAEGTLPDTDAPAGPVAASNPAAATNAAASPPEVVQPAEHRPSAEAASAAAATAAAALPPPVATVAEPPPAIDAPAFVVIDRACGSVVWGKNENERLAPASLTKIVTALAIMDMESLDADAESHVSGSAMKARGSSVMGLEPGVHLSILDLLNGLMLKSGNDAALVLAEHAGGGNVDAFMTAMNAKAQAIGMSNSHFANPHGLDQDGHFSTALDMAKAGAALLDNPVLAGISATPEYSWDGTALRNGNKLLQRYPGAYGVKIGYTEGASQTIVAAAERDGRHVIVSVFGSDDRYTDSTLLLDWAFAKTTSGCP